MARSPTTRAMATTRQLALCTGVIGVPSQGRATILALLRLLQGDRQSIGHWASSLHGSMLPHNQHGKEKHKGKELMARLCAPQNRESSGSIAGRHWEIPPDGAILLAAETLTEEVGLASEPEVL